VKVSRKWVQGHQDKKIECSELPIEAQMNCEADTEAHRCQQEEGAVRTEVFHLGSNTAQLHAQGQTIN